MSRVNAKGTFGSPAPAKGQLTPEAGAGVSAWGTAPPRVRGYVTLWSPETGTSVQARHWERPQVTQERAGGWQAVERPGLLPVTDWDGPQPLKVRLTLLVDGYDQQPKRPVDRELDALRSFGYRVDRLDRPPVVQIIGAVPYADGGILESHKNVPPEWVVEALDIEEVLSTSSGNPARAKVTIDLLEFAPAETDVRRVKTSKARPYTWKKGDTLRGVARRELGSPERAALIREANPSVKFGSIKPGAKIRIPGISG